MKRGSRWMGVALLLCGATTPLVATADQLKAEQHDGETGYVAVEELSYETIIEAADGYAATLRLRVALHNSSLSPRDVVHSLGLPFASQLVGVSVVRDGAWTPGVATTQANEASARGTRSVYARELAPASRNDNGGAELVATGLAPDATLQVELEVRVFPRLRGDHWELDLPARGVGSLALAEQRRVLVRGLSKSQHFSVDEETNGDKPFVITRPEDTVTVSWPAQLRSAHALEANAELVPGPPGFDDGSFRLYVRLGEETPSNPSHVLFVVDHSKSTPKAMDASVERMINGVLDSVPSSTTFDAIAFNRTPTALLSERGSYGKAGSTRDRAVLREALAAHPRDQGTDLKAAMAEAARRAKDGRGRTLVVVATDGMFPTQTSAADVGRAFDTALGNRKRRPDVVFVIDEPMLQRSGIDTHHPAARVAAALGARISLESIDQLGGTAARDLLATPRALGGLEVKLPGNADLDDPVPEGLVAGSFVMLRGHYVGKAPKSFKVSGHFGPTEVSRTIEAAPQPRVPAAFVAAPADELRQAALEGFAQPAWYLPAYEREARAGITQSGRFGRNKKKGFLDQKVFRHYLTTRVLPRARACYNDALTRDLEIEGRVVLEMEVGKGEVMQARVSENDLERKDTKLDACLTEAAWSLDAPAGVMDDQIYRLRYPLRLVAPPEGKLAGSVAPISDDVMELLLSQPLPDKAGG